MSENVMWYILLYIIYSAHGTYIYKYAVLNRELQTTNKSPSLCSSACTLPISTVLELSIFGNRRLKYWFSLLWLQLAKNWMTFCICLYLLYILRDVVKLLNLQKMWYDRCIRWKTLKEIHLRTKTFSSNLEAWDGLIHIAIGEELKNIASIIQSDDGNADIILWTSTCWSQYFIIQELSGSPLQTCPIKSREMSKNIISCRTSIF